MRIRRVVVRLMVAVGAAAATVATGVLAAAHPVSADQDDDHEGPQAEVLEVSGDFTGRGSLSSENCEFIRVVVDGSGDWTGLGISTFTLNFCTGTTTGGVTYQINAATFTVTTTDGTLSGDMSGTVDAGLPPPNVEFPFAFDLTVDEGTGRFDTATGTLTMEGAFGLGASTMWGSVSGSVTIPPPTPNSIQDCLHGGWRELVDDEGQPFRNVGHCIRFVRRH